MGKTRITYRFDGKDQGTAPGWRQEDHGRKVIPLYEEEFQVMQDTQPGHAVFTAVAEADAGKPLRDTYSLNQYTTDFGAWQSQFDPETARVEQAIRETGTGRNRPYPQEAARPVEEPERRESPYCREELPERHDPYEPLHDYGGPVWQEPIPSRTAYRSHSQAPLLKVVLSIAGAAVTGVLLGFFVLSLFSNGGASSPSSLISSLKERAFPAAGDSAQNSDAAALPVSAQPAADQGAAAANSGGAASAGISVQIPAVTYAVLQNGIFGSEQAAQTAQTALRDKGFAAATEVGDKFTVYAGIAASKEDLQTLGNELKQKQVDIYAKVYTLPAADKAIWNGKPDTLTSFLSGGDKLVRMMSGLTLVHLGEVKSTPLDDPTLASLHAAHDAWAAAAAQAVKDAPEAGKAPLQAMLNAMNTAAASLDAYKKSPAEAMLWQAQTNLMQYVLAEKNLLAAITAE